MTTDRKPAVSAVSAAPFDGRRGADAESGIVWRETAPGEWKISRENAVALVASEGMLTLAQAQAALPAASTPAVESEAPASEFEAAPSVAAPEPDVQDEQAGPA